MTDNFNINEINPELLQQLLVALDQQRQPQEQQTMDKFATFDLPREKNSRIWTSLPKKSSRGAINKVFTQDYKKYNVDSYQFISNKYKDADRLRVAARGGADIFQDLQALISRGGAGEEEISQIMEKARRLSVYAFASSKTIDNEAKTIATKALRLPGNLINWMMKKTTTTRKWPSLQKWFSKSKKHDMMTESSEVPNPPIIAFEEDLTMEEPEVDSEAEVDLSITRVFLGEGEVSTPGIVVEEDTTTITNQALSNPTILPPTNSNSTGYVTNDTTNTNIENPKKSENPQYSKITKNSENSKNSVSYRTSRWDSTRGAPQPFLPQLAEDDDSQLAVVNCPRRLPNTICITTDSMETTKADGFSSSGTSCRRCCGQQVFGIRSNRNSSGSNGHSLSFAVLYDQGTHQVSPDFRLQENQQFCPMRTFQDGRCSNFEGDDSGRRFSFKNRPEGCLCGSPHSPSVKAFSFLFAPGNSLQIQIPSFWTKCSAKSFFQIDETCNRAFAERRYPNGLLPGRSVFSSEYGSGDESSHQEGNFSFAGFRVHHQLGQEQTGPLSSPRIFGLRIRYSEHEDQCSHEEDHQPSTENPTGKEMELSLVPLGGSTFGQDDGHDPGNWGSFVTDPLPTTGSGEQLTFASSELGKALPPFNPRPSRLRLVGTHGYNQEWSSDYASDTGWGIHSKLMDTAGYWTLRERDDSINVRELKTILFALQLHGPKNPNSVMLIHTDNTTALNPGYSGSVQQVQLASILPAHCGNTERESGCPEQGDDSRLRVETPTILDEQDTTEVARSQYRCVCVKGKQKASSVLVSANGPRCSSNRCIYASVAEEGSFPTPTLEIDSSSFAEIDDRSSSGGSDGDTVLADTILVANGNAVCPGERQTDRDPPDQSSLAFDRLEIIKSYKAQVMSDEANIFLENTVRASTSKTYNAAWIRWVTYCQQYHWHPCEYNVLHVLEFLVAHKHLSKSPVGF
ncbi:hypothetical protein G6F56_006934 [Rhizopus delemar]|nr:hypothetical protein G6F56_006934 [Rhizopus delemar]